MRLPVQVYETSDGLLLSRPLPGHNDELNLYDDELEGLLVAAMVRLHHLGKLGSAVDALLGQVRAGEVEIL